MLLLFSICWVCFTPAEKCLPKILQQVSQAKKSIKVQCYSFTLKELADLLIQKHKEENVQVEVISDRSQLWQRYSQVIHLIRSGIPVYIDDRVAIAHNKVIIIDDAYVLTGSYNWSQGAENRNAENIQCDKDEKIVAAYINNFYQRKQASTYVTSETIDGYLAQRKKNKETEVDIEDEPEEHKNS